MKNKLTLKDCFKYPLANIKKYHKGEVVAEYRNILELLEICFCKYALVTEKEINKVLSKCKLMLVEYFDKETDYLFADYVRAKESDDLRILNYDIDEMEKQGKALHERKKQNPYGVF